MGLTAIPQAIVYGTIAGLTPQYGLYSAFMGCFAYIFFGTCKDVTIGKYEFCTMHAIHAYVIIDADINCMNINNVLISHKYFHF